MHSPFIYSCLVSVPPSPVQVAPSVSFSSISSCPCCNQFLGFQSYFLYEKSPIVISAATFLYSTLSPLYPLLPTQNVFYFLVISLYPLPSVQVVLFVSPSTNPNCHLYIYFTPFSVVTSVFPSTIPSFHHCISLPFSAFISIQPSLIPSCPTISHSTTPSCLLSPSTNPNCHLCIHFSLFPVVRFTSHPHSPSPVVTSVSPFLYFQFSPLYPLSPTPVSVFPPTIPGHICAPLPPFPIVPSVSP